MGLLGVSYVGTVLSDAQIAMQVLQNKLLANHGWSDVELFEYFGGIAIPEAIIEWASKSDGDLSQLFAIPALTPFAYSPSVAANTTIASTTLTMTPNSTAHGRQVYSVSCGLDSMAHVNKGIVGIRLEFLDGVYMSNVHVSNFENTGLEGSAICHALTGSEEPSAHAPPVENGTGELAIASKGQAEYLGADVRGIELAVSNNMLAEGGVSVMDLRTSRGRAYGVDVRESTEQLNINVNVKRLIGGLGGADFVALPDPSGAGTYRIQKGGLPALL